MTLWDLNHDAFKEGEMELPKEVIIEDYQFDWPQQFEDEKARIRSALHNSNIAIEHIGSTSVFGLPAKPILDIAVGVHDLSEADQFIAPLQEIGYEYVPKPDFPNRRFFRKGEWRQGTHHLHVYSIHSEEWNNQLLFRDYLRNHPETAEEYAQLKRKLAILHAGNRETYTKLKAPFIQSVIEMAKTFHK